MNKFEKYKESIIKEIKEIFKDNLISIILYGSYIKGGYVYKKSDINLMLVRRNRDNNELIRLNNFYRKYFSKIKLSLPLVLTMDEIRSSVDVYPMEYMDIKNYNQVVYGKDIFTSLKIGMGNLRIELENQVKSKLIYLRESLVNYYNNKKILKMILLNSISSMVIILRNILELNNKHVPVPVDELIGTASGIIGFKLDSFKKLVKYRNGQIKFGRKQLLSLYQGSVHEFECLADYVDGFKSGKK